jgi:hypothetical protein
MTGEQYGDKGENRHTVVECSDSRFCGQWWNSWEKAVLVEVVFHWGMDWIGFGGKSSRCWMLEWKDCVVGLVQMHDGERCEGSLVERWRPSGDKPIGRVGHYVGHYWDQSRVIEFERWVGVAVHAIDKTAVVVEDDERGKRKDKMAERWWMGSNRLEAAVWGMNKIVEVEDEKEMGWMRMMVMMVRGRSRERNVDAVRNYLLMGRPL